MTKANQRKLLIMLAVVLWMAIIFKLSAQPGEQSNLLSTKVTTRHRQPGATIPA